MRAKPTSGVISVYEQNQAIQIHDNYRWLLLSKRLFYVFFAANALVITLHLTSGNAASFSDWFWISIGVLATIFLFRSLKNRTAVSEIPIAQIRGISKHTFLGSGLLKIHLENEKVREIRQSLSKQDVDYLRDLIEGEPAHASL